MAQLSVLMSIYINEKTEYVQACFESLLGQTVQADEWVIVEDGPLTAEMYKLINRFQMEHPELIKRVKLNSNQGLGIALRIGVENCSNEIIARMDTDDIARQDRFEKQLKEFDIDPELDICGSQIDEFDDDPDIIVSKRIVPIKHEDIIEYQKLRDAFNHMTVMYKKKAVLSAGNYQKCPLMEDTYLWARMIMNGSKCLNIDEALVHVRIGKEMIKRRGGWDYLKKYCYGQKMVHKTGYTSWFNYIYISSIQFFVALMPSGMRAIVFKKLLHK
ncbi:glycosyltransferase [Butyrivibrio sp. LC3010]|uniref:glycosyltransferase n=1 Tax=Butyrivibrio sp. LC3010 TaxID=1280680 RepID=UPI0003F56494|nr:glycosyltransferase [Butyrivibrio sp. LC3010]